MTAARHRANLPMLLLYDLDRTCEPALIEEFIDGRELHVSLPGNSASDTSRFITPGARVLIKPNLICARDSSTGTTTNPAVVEAIAHWAWEAGAAEVLIGDGSGVGHDTHKVFRALGYDRVASRCRASLVDLNKNPIKVACPDGRVLKEIAVSKTVLETDVLINVPVLKTHSQPMPHSQDPLKRATSSHVICK